MLEKTIHRSGLTILSYYNPQLPSFAMSLTLKSGSRAETKENSGIHHFIEHMIFKGSKHYDLREIAELSDRLGGSLNAYTSKEVTQYYIKAIDEKFKDTFSLLSDMLMDSTFPEKEFIKEKNVILQEIKESIDSPDSHSFELFYEDFFKNSSLGFPIAGTKISVGNMNRDDVFDFYKSKYTPENLVLSLSGNIKHKDILKLVDKKFQGYPDSNAKKMAFVKSEMSFNSFLKKRDLNQLYTIIGFRGISSSSPHRFSFMVANDILGSGMSSRLFQKIREEKGLAYTISSFPDSFVEDGILIIYSIIKPKKVTEYLNAVKEELLSLKEFGITDAELERSKDHIKSSVILGLESNTTRMQFIVSQEMYNNKPLEIKEIIKIIQDLKKEDINKIFNTVLNISEHTIFYYGNTEYSKKNYNLS